MKVQGGCHCRAVRFEAEVAPDASLLDCNCSICSKSGLLHLIVPHDQFTLLSGQETLSEYRFGSGAARHLFCKHCGIKSFYQPRSHPGAWSVNFRCLDPDHGLDLPTRHFDGRNWEAARTAL